jgi:hypothetical protein
VRSSFAASHDDALGFDNDFPEPAGPVQTAAPAFSESISDRAVEEPRMPEPVPAAMNLSADAISLETMRSAMVANFEQEDLDVPAFLRKRGDVM